MFPSSNPTNPYTVMRTLLRMTQEDLAKAANTSTQYVRRQEQGTVSSASGSMSVALYHKALSQNKTDILRAVVGKSLRALRIASPVVYEGPTAFHNPYTFEQLVSAWYDYWLRVERSKVTPAHVAGAPSLYALCRVLLVHTYIVQRWLKASGLDGHGWLTSGLRDIDQPLPEPIIRALNDTQTVAPGVSREQFMEKLRDLTL